MTTNTEIMPSAVEIESMLLGGAMIDAEILDIIVERLDAADFYHSSNQMLFTAMVERQRASKIVELPVMCTEYPHLSDHILDISGKICTTKSVDAYIKIVRDKSALRKLAKFAAETRVLACSGDEPEEILDYAEAGYAACFDNKEFQKERSTLQILPETFAEIERAAKGEMLGIPTGSKKLDDAIAGFERGMLYIIAGRPSMGKTAYAMSLAINQAVEYKIPLAIFSLEMPARQLTMRWLAMISDVNGFLLRTGKLPRRDYPKISMEASKLSEAPIYIDDQSILNVAGVRAKLRRMKRQHGIKCAFIDHIHLMKFKGEDRNRGLGEISAGLKGIAKDLDIPIIALAQLSRNPEAKGRKDRRPNMADLRDSGAIEQDADVIMFVYRDFVYNKDADPTAAEIIIGKQRNGPLDTLEYHYKAQCAKFSDFGDGGDNGGF